MTEQVPQVCDRCRSKKIRCDGVRPSCDKCQEAGVACTVSALLSRRTKPRRYGSSEASETKRLRAEIAELRAAVQSLKSPQARSQQSPTTHPTSHAVDLHVTEESVSPSMSNSAQRYEVPQTTTPGSVATSAATQGTQPDAVIRHLGRLVSIGRGSVLFAGSTTGVHFSQTVDHKYQQLVNYKDRFPDALFRLHLLPSPEMLRPSMNMAVAVSRTDICLPLNSEYYLARVENFFQHWNHHLPILCRRQATQSFISVLHSRLDHGRFAVCDVPSLHQLLTILAIEAWDADNTEYQTSAGQYFSMASELQHELDSAISLETVQSSVLSILYLQLSGKHTLVNCAVGSAVRSAQALGLHRNPKRFQICAGEQELRTRIWWCIAALETTSSISYGLPRLLRACDSDVGLPTECELDDSTATTLPFNLPGEAPSVAFFISYCRLTTIIHHLSELLYTTTERRDGERKIVLLDRRLHVWAHDLNSLIETTHVNPHRFSQAFLRLLGHSCMILIHQPALTFEESHPQFKRSLAASTGSAAALLTTLDRYSYKRRLFYMQPSAIRLVFQSALLCLFYCLYNTTTELPTTNTLFSDDGVAAHGETYTTEMAVDVAIRLLNRHLDEYTVDRLRLSGEETSGIQQVIRDAIRILQDMRRKFCWMSHIDTGQRMDHSVAEVDPMQWPSALWSMNVPDLTEWTDDYAMETLQDFGYVDAMRRSTG